MGHDLAKTPVRDFPTFRLHADCKHAAAQWICEGAQVQPSCPTDFGTATLFQQIELISLLPKFWINIRLQSIESIFSTHEVFNTPKYVREKESNPAKTRTIFTQSILCHPLLVLTCCRLPACRLRIHGLPIRRPFVSFILTKRRPRKRF